MKQHLNTLFVTTEGAYLAKDGQAAVVRHQKQDLLRVPLHNLDGIVCLARVGRSPYLMAACAAGGVRISFCNTHGRFQAAVIGFQPGNVLLRRQQFRVADDEPAALAIAAPMIAAKIANCRSVLLRAIRDSPSVNDVLEPITKRLAFQIDFARGSSSLDQLRGIEGDSAASYFGVFSHLMTAKDVGFSFGNRSRRPPLDPVNSLLSFLYAMLAHDARSACEAAGLDAAVGFLHRDRPGRPGLALDLMEEFRPFLVDRLVLSLINRRQLSLSDFVTTASSAVHAGAD